MPAIVSRRRADLGESRPRSNVPRGHAGMTRPVASPTSFESVRVRAPTRAWCCTKGSFFAVTYSPVRFKAFSACVHVSTSRLTIQIPASRQPTTRFLRQAVRTGVFSGVNVSPRGRAAQSSPVLLGLPAQRCDTPPAFRAIRSCRRLHRPQRLREDAKSHTSHEFWSVHRELCGFRSAIDASYSHRQ